MGIRLNVAPGFKRQRPTRARTRTRPALVPAAGRTPTLLNQAEVDLSADAIEAFALAVGGRRQLLQTLAIADSAASSDKVINCLLDPTYASWSLRRICTYAGITVADLFATYKKACFVRAHVEATRIITERLPTIVGDVMARALPLPVTCPRCYGAPSTPDTSPCPQCKGEGTILAAPDLDRQKVALELGRVLERKGGVVMQQNQISASTQQVTMNAPGSLEQLQQAVGDLLFAPERRRAASPPLTVTVASDERGEAPPDHAVRDDPASREPRFPHEEEPPLPFPDDDEEDDEPLQT